MPKFELEIDDKGDFVGQLPPEVDAILKRIEITAHGTGFRGGQSKAAEEAKQQLDSAIKAERARIEASLPLEREKWQAIEADNQTLKTQLTDTIRESSRTLTKREEAHAEEITKRADALNKRNARIMELTKAQLRGEARAIGARDESLDELEVILHASIGYDDDMQPYVRNADGSPRNVQGKPQALASFVKEYLDTHTHHRKPAPGQGGGARGGASTHGHNGSSMSLEAARAEVQSNPHSAQAVNALFEATRKK